jgi:lysophospholipase L1-like esterase
MKRQLQLNIAAISLLALLAAPVRLPAAEPQTNKWEATIAAFEQKDQQTPPPKDAILFVGSSSIRMWNTASSFPTFTTINRGFGGSYMSDVARYAERIVTPYKPRLIVVYAGGNDIAGKRSAEQVFAAHKDFVAIVRKSLPKTPIIYIALAPNPKRWLLYPEMQKANALIRDYAKAGDQLRFLDFGPQMLGADGQPRPELYRDDKLHLNAEGYKLWNSLLLPHLKGE